MFTLKVDSVWPGIWQRLFLPLFVVIGLSTHEAKSAPADWFPDSPSIRHYAWEYEPCTGCEVLAPSPVWTRMAALAGLGDFGLALRVSYLWQKQEREADWLGALLAAQACGCGIESGALAYFQHGNEGGGIAAAHAPNAERIRQLLPFAESARRLVELGTH